LQRPEARSENQIVASMQAKPSAGPMTTRPVRKRSNSVPKPASATRSEPAALPKMSQPSPKATRPRNATAISNTGQTLRYGQASPG
jgi:hypothetical protein